MSSETLQALRERREFEMLVFRVLSLGEIGMLLLTAPESQMSWEMKCAERLESEGLLEKSKEGASSSSFFYKRTPKGEALVQYLARKTR